MADVLLIYPYIGDMDVIREKPHLPLGLIQAASLTAPHYDVKLIDLRITPHWHAVIKTELLKNPLYVGLSVMSGQPVARAWEVSDFIKKTSDIPVVWGGNHPSLSPLETIQDPAVDVVIIGDGEQAMLELTDNLASNKSLSGIKGLWFKQGEEVVQNQLGGPVDLDSLPLPPYYLVNVEDYVQEYCGKRMVNLETSRGCSHQCRYCYHTGQTGHHHFRFLSVEKSLERILWAMESFGVDGVYLVDDNFFVNKKRGMEIVRGLKAQKKKVFWQIQGVGVPSMLQFSDSELSDIESSGLLRISVGAESGSPRILQYVDKPHTVEMLFEANKLWSRTKINIVYSWLAGFPGETIEDVKKTIRVMFRIMKENPHARLSPMYNFLPYPGTNLWKELIEKYDFQPPKRLVDWGNYDWNHVNVSYLDPKLKKMLDNLYFPSLCIDSKFDDFPVPWWLYWGVRLYRPIARARMKTMFYRFPVENIMAAGLEKILAAGKRVRTPWTL